MVGDSVEVCNKEVNKKEDRQKHLSVGIGLTNDCNLRCAHCYRDTQRISHVSLEQVKMICECLPVGAVGFGTGENALNPEFVPTIEYLHERGVKLSLASNGHSLLALSDEHLRAFHDVEVSIDFPTAKEQDAFRGEGNWALVHRAIERCHKLGVPASILTTLMSANYERMNKLVDLARAQGTLLRVNVYQPVRTARFKLSYGQFWAAYRHLFHCAPVVSCTEPVVRAAMGLGDVHSPCGHTSIRFNQFGQITPCVYWPLRDSASTIADLPRLGLRVMELDYVRQARAVPEGAAKCRCQGGCASRRALNGKSVGGKSVGKSANSDSFDGNSLSGDGEFGDGDVSNAELKAHDEYCPWVRGEEIRLDWRPAPAIDMMRAGNVCTTIVAP